MKSTHFTKIKDNDDDNKSTYMSKDYIMFQ